VITLGSLSKISELSGGGETIALMLGGRAVNPHTTDLAERRLLNVVEEMALASGIPVPPVFVLDNEPSINAFAAGHKPNNAVVAVSAGCLQYLSRDELQGVLGHEFSHILNGDMRLNLRLIGIVYGILVVAVLGYYVMRIGGQAAASRSERDGNGLALAMLAAGLILLALGYIGVFFAKLIKAAVSRQREFLADASSVQFTRNPGGITGALKKIGGLSAGSRIQDAHAAEVSHMFFGDAFAGSFFNLFATHPPLVQRIKRWDATFDGQFPETHQVEVSPDSIEGPALAGGSGEIAAGAVVASLSGGAAAAPAAAHVRNIAQQIGRPDTEHLDHAGRLREAIPPMLLTAAREPSVARAVVYALLLSRDDLAARTQQLALLQRAIEPALYRETLQLAAVAQELAAASRLPVVDLAVPALKRASPQQYAEFRRNVEALVTADGKVDLFEYCLRTVLFSYLDVHFGMKKPPAVRYRTVAAVAQPAAAVLSTLAYVGQNEPDAIGQAFQAGAQTLPVPITILPQDQCTLKAFDAALAELACVAPAVKRDLLTAVAATIAADGQVTLEEGELLRVIAAVMACPVPPMGAGVRD
jgi:Zn-dependent protease with chaperone function